MKQLNVSVVMIALKLSENYMKSTKATEGKKNKV